MNFYYDSQYKLFINVKCKDKILSKILTIKPKFWPWKSKILTFFRQKLPIMIINRWELWLALEIECKSEWNQKSGCSLWCCIRLIAEVCSAHWQVVNGTSESSTTRRARWTLPGWYLLPAVVRKKQKKNERKKAEDTYRQIGDFRVLFKDIADHSWSYFIILLLRKNCADFATLYPLSPIVIDCDWLEEMFHSSW